MKTESKKIIRIFYLVIIIVIIVLIFKYYILPLFPNSFQNTIFQIISDILIIISSIYGLLKIVEIIYKYCLKKVPDNKEPIDIRSWTNYKRLFEIDEYRLPYLPIINNWWKDKKIIKIDWNLMDQSEKLRREK